MFIILDFNHKYERFSFYSLLLRNKAQMSSFIILITKHNCFLSYSKILLQISIKNSAEALNNNKDSLIYIIFLIIYDK